MSDATTPSTENPGFDDMARDIAEVPAVEVIVTVAVNLMSAAAVKLGLTEEGDTYKDLDEARKLVHALAGLLDASATEISSFHAAPLRDGLKSLQLAFREASLVPDDPGQGGSAGPPAPRPHRRGGCSRASGWSGDQRVKRGSPGAIVSAGSSARSR